MPSAGSAQAPASAADLLALLRVLGHGELNEHLSALKLQGFRDHCMLLGLKESGIKSMFAEHIAVLAASPGDVVDDNLADKEEGASSEGAAQAQPKFGAGAETSGTKANVEEATLASEAAPAVDEQKSPQPAAEEPAPVPEVAPVVHEVESPKSEVEDPALAVGIVPAVAEHGPL